MISVAVAGAAGRMGREVVRTLLQQADMRLAAAYDVTERGSDAAVLAGGTACGVTVTELTGATLASSGSQVLVDFTTAESAAANAQLALSQNVSPVIGTTGMGEAQLDKLASLARSKGIGAIYAPNFSIGAVLMMHLAKVAARFLDRAEIVELHHDAKKDAPSGTARLTAQRIASIWQSSASSASGPSTPARGETVEGVPIHSVRLPGLIAHQEVIFGAQGQTLTIRHDSLDRVSFMPGILLAIRRVRDLPGLVVGLDTLLGLE